MKKLFVLMLALMLVFSVVSVGTAETGSKKLVIWSMFSEEVFDDLIKQFCEQHPEYEFEILSIPWANDTWSQKMLTALMSKEMPDIVFSQQGGAEWSEPVKGVYRSLNEYFEASSYELSDYPVSLINNQILNGQIYGLPVFFDYRVMYANPKLLKDNGFETVPKTWDELLQYNETITKFNTEGNLEKLGFVLTESKDSVFYALATANGGYTFSSDGRKFQVNSPEFIAAAEYMKKICDQVGGMESSAKLAPKASGIADSFVSENSALDYLSAVDELSKIEQYNPDLEFVVAPIPAPEGKEQKTIQTYSGTVFITTGCKDPDAAWEFVNYWQSREGLLTFVKSCWPLRGGIPGRLSVANDPEYLAINKNLPQIVENVKNLAPIGHVMHPLANDIYWNNMSTAVDSILYGTATADAELNRVNQICQEQLDELLENLDSQGIEMNISLY